ncbi:hypothetical protein V9T40_012108 [Parthenolecanium corni]|uniref:Uncharacterized protein n=1 Tax=Parthenolecanium corni TaxID=536013 RepID=A0AAN9XZ12_9HEMI
MYIIKSVYHQVSIPSAIKMNSLIIFISFLVFTEIQVTLCNEQPADPQGAEDKQGEAQLSIDEVWDIGEAKRDQAKQAAKSTYEALKTSIDKRKIEARAEYAKAMQKHKKEYQRIKSLADGVSKRRQTKLADTTKQNAFRNYEKIIAQADKDLENAKAAQVRANKAANDEFKKTLDRIKEMEINLKDEPEPVSNVRKEEEEEEGENEK